MLAEPITVEVYTHHEDVLLAAQEALDNHLYIDGWSLQEYLDMTLDGYTKAIIVMAYHDSKPVGIIYARDEFSGVFVQFFVKKELRRQGIGTKLFDALKSSQDEHTKYLGLKGVDGSIEFFRAVGVNLEH